MKPIKFPESNSILTAPEGMSNCSDLPTYKTGTYIISCWKLSLWERVQLFLTGKAWLWVHSELTHPPIAITSQHPFKKIRWWSEW